MIYLFFPFQMFDFVPIFILLIFILVFGVIIFRVIKSLSTWHSNNKAEVVEVRATVKDKRDEVSVYGGHNTHARSSTNYYVTFELSDLERKEFEVKANQYGLLSVGDQGLLNYQGTRFNSFERSRVVDDRFNY